MNQYKVTVAFGQADQERGRELDHQIVTAPDIRRADEIAAQGLLEEFGDEGEWEIISVEQVPAKR